MRGGEGQRVSRGEAEGRRVIEISIISRESWGETPAGRPRPGTGTRRRGGIIDTERGVHDPNADVPAAERTKRDGRYSRRRGLCDRSSARSWPLPSPNVQLIFITFCPLRTWAHSRLTEFAQAKALLLCEPSVARTGGEKSLSLARPFTLAVTGHDQPRPSLTSSRLTSRRRERPHSDTHTRGASAVASFQGPSAFHAANSRIHPSLKEQRKDERRRPRLRQRQLRGGARQAQGHRRRAQHRVQARDPVDGQLRR